jgi:hypothetical protein
MSRSEKDERRVIAAQLEVLRGIADQLRALTELMHSFGDKARGDRAWEACQEADREMGRRTQTGADDAPIA